MLSDPQKLRILPDAELVLLNAPESLKAVFQSWGNCTDRLSDTPHEWIIAFLSSIADLQALVPQILGALTPSGICWIAFPKKSSGVQSDLNRDSAYQALQAYPLQWLSLVAIDSTWSACALRKATQIRQAKARPGHQPGAEVNPYINYAERKVSLPSFVVEALSPDPGALEYFQSLSFSHQKEYVLWVSGAKKQETIDARVKKMLVLLQQKQKNPFGR
jgi:hypothetical protein